MKNYGLISEQHVRTDYQLVQVLGVRGKWTRRIATKPSYEEAVAEARRLNLNPVKGEDSFIMEVRR